MGFCLPQEGFAFPYKLIGLQNSLEASQMQLRKKSPVGQMHLSMISGASQTDATNLSLKPTDTDP